MCDTEQVKMNLQLTYHVKIIYKLYMSKTQLKIQKHKDNKIQSNVM
jgi:hypothetical protein